MTNETTVWIDGSEVELGLSIPPHGPLLRGLLPDLTLMASLSGGELLRYTYDVTDPETGEVIRGAARLRIEPLPDPRDTITATEEQPATPVGATVGYLQAFKAVTDQTSDVNPAADPITPEERAEGARVTEQWLERPSGPPARILVDGPGCTPTEVPNEAGELVRTGSLYSDKCAECTTGVSCEDAGRCLFEG